MRMFIWTGIILVVLGLGMCTGNRWAYFSICNDLQETNRIVVRTGDNHYGIITGGCEAIENPSIPDLLMDKNK